MINRILPQVLDDRFAGHAGAVWLLAVFVLVRILMSISMIANARVVAGGPDGIPLDSFGEPAASRFLSLFAVLGVCQLALALVGVLALVRYQAMIPLIYLVFLGEILARRLLLLNKPLASEGSPPIGFYFNMALLALLVVGLVLSLRPSS